MKDYGVYSIETKCRGFKVPGKMVIRDSASKTIVFKQFNLTKGKGVKNPPEIYTVFSLGPLTLSPYLGLFLLKIWYQPTFTTAINHLHSNLDNWNCPELQKDKIFQNFNDFNKCLNGLPFIQQIQDIYFVQHF